MQSESFTTVFLCTLDFLFVKLQPKGLLNVMAVNVKSDNIRGINKTNMHDANLCINSVWRPENELEADETSNFLLLRL